MNIGKLYDVSHRRSGDYQIRLEGEDETWAWGVITDGETRAILEYNEKETGIEIHTSEKITVRKSLCTLTEVE